MVTLANNEIHILPNPEEVFVLVAEDFTRRAVQAVQDKGEFTVVLPGGDTPKFFFDKIASDKEYNEKIPWQQIKFFFGDERYVPLDNTESNYHLAYEHLFSRVPILEKNIYRIPTDFKDPNQAAKAYEETLRSYFHIKKNEFPAFDLIYLGLGADAHTASLMPLSDVVGDYSKKTDSYTDKESKSHKKYRLVESLWVKKLNMYRITLTPPAINHAMNIIFLVIGQSKAAAVWNVLEGKTLPEEYPAQLIHCVNNNIWYLDQAAASQLGSSRTNS